MGLICYIVLPNMVNGSSVKVSPFWPIAPRLPPNGRCGSCRFAETTDVGKSSMQMGQNVKHPKLKLKIQRSCRLSLASSKTVCIIHDQLPKWTAGSTSNQLLHQLLQTQLRIQIKALWANSNQWSVLGDDLEFRTLARHRLGLCSKSLEDAIVWSRKRRVDIGDRLNQIWYYITKSDIYIYIKIISIKLEKRTRIEFWQGKIMRYKSHINAKSAIAGGNFFTAFQSSGE